MRKKQKALIFRSEKFSRWFIIAIIILLFIWGIAAFISPTFALLPEIECIIPASYMSDSKEDLFMIGVTISSRGSISAGRKIHVEADIAIKSIVTKHSIEDQARDVVCLGVEE